MISNIPRFPRLSDIPNPTSTNLPKPLPYETGPKWMAIAGFLAVVIPVMAISSYAIGHWVLKQLTK